MKILFKLYLLVFIVSFFGVASRVLPEAFAADLIAGRSNSLSFSQVLAQAARRPTVLAAEARATAADLEADAVFRAAWLPNIEARYSVNDRDHNLSLPTPVGSLPLGDGSWQTFGTRITQPLFDPARALYAIPAARSQATAADYSARRRQEEMVAAAGHVFFDIQVLDARRQSLQKYLEALQKRVAESQILWAGGRILKADLLKVRLAQDNVAQEMLSLNQHRKVATWSLGRATGTPGPVEPFGKAQFPAISQLRSEKSETNLTETNPPEINSNEERSDLLALQHQIVAVDGQGKTLRAAALPRFELQLQWTWSDQDIVTPESWGEGALALVWNPFAGGQRLAQAKARFAEAQALDELLEEARQGVRLEITRAQAAMVVAQGEIALGQTGVEQAQEYQRVTRERFLAGRATTARLLEAEAALNEQRTKSSVAAIELQRAHLEFHLAEGSLLSLVTGYGN